MIMVAEIVLMQLCGMIKSFFRGVSSHVLTIFHRKNKAAYRTDTGTIAVNIFWPLLNESNWREFITK